MGNICHPPANQQEPVNNKRGRDSVQRKASIVSKKTLSTAGSKGASLSLTEAIAESAATEQPQVPYEKKALWTYDQETLDLIKQQIKKKIVTEDPQTNSEKIAVLFDRLDKWEFPIMELEQLTDGNPLVYMTYALLLQYDLFKKFKLDEANMVQFLTRIQSLYGNNPYHNSCHAAQTVHTFHYMIRRGLNQYLSDEDTFACILAAIAIDLVHPGLDNDFQANVESSASTLYNDLNILENNSATTLFELIREFNVFESFTKEQQPELRELIIEMILASDLHDHQLYLDGFKTRVDAACEFSNREDIRNILQITLKMCDFAHYMKGSKLYKEFTRRHLTERFNQGDLEKKLNLPVKEENDREKLDNLNTYQMQYMDTYVKPLLKSYKDILPKLKFLLTAIRKNYKYWTVSDEELLQQFKLIELPRIDMQPSQEAYDQMIRDRPVPKDQDMNVDPEEQEKERPVPSEKDKELEKQCIEKVHERFDVENKSVADSEEKPNGGKADRPPVYSVYDLKAHPLDSLADDDRRKSVLAVFDRIDDWNFDVFVLSQLLGNHAMLISAWALFQKHDLFREFKIPTDVFTNFFREVQEGYQMNPYHNAMHACDVMQITHAIIINGHMTEKMSKLDAMAAVLSSAVHDLDHPGLNNAYQVNSHSYLTTIYNDRSVLENHHCAQTFQIIRKDEKYNIFKTMSKGQQRDARLTMVGMIIATDMTNHGKYVKLFNSRIESGSEFKEKDDIRVALQIAIKMADVSNPSRPLYLYLQWTDKIIFEFFRQGDKEKDNGFPISPLMDRNTAVLSKGQIAFMQYVIVPMFNSFATVFPGMKFVMKHIENNKAYWESHSAIDEQDLDPFRKERSSNTVMNDE
mmetsp:Transcript_2652/g.10165  ORF Transcript_2652/g.10165 Transcript_2652/m.10165 type:complete len:861 (-) Transcript_2652:2457-5039(-)|eukprot:CAMPEP_0117441572 /NCGR_PEP_ID=MMETSP0759-20121206/3703_1 /TAXON_ID=63605 /ORGANISM="Percolomonas cosmopolitus, Strain WS" /LENGTH=860 /DNA_ID=CAMNT_0005233429 /DNA_START=447 /DNA_END=3029 /DNA_ORIENTATION=-